MAGTATTPMSTGLLRTNYARIGHAAQEVFPKLLQDLLILLKLPIDLYADVCNNSYLNMFLGPDEWLKINKARANGYADFDISLCYKIIRNLELVRPPTNGWGSEPSSTDIRLPDDIERIRQKRNEIIHRGNTNVDDKEMGEYFVLFKHIAERLEPFLGKAKDEIVKMFTQLEACSMDEKTEKMYLEDIEILRKREEDLIKTVENLKGDVKEVKEDVKVVTKDVIEVKEDVKIVTKDVEEVKEDVKGVIKDIIEVKEDVKVVKDDVDSMKYSGFMKDIIAEWQKEQEYFVKTEAVEDILKSLKENHVCCITGSSGIGKSASMHHVALNLQEKQGYQICQCFNPSDIFFTKNKEGKKQVFVFDDVCGKYTLIQNDVEEWIKQEDVIETIITSCKKIKILTTSRSQVSCDPQFKRIKLFQDKCCDLSADAYSLSYDMKLKIAKQYLPAHVVDSIKDELDEYELLPLMFMLYKSLSVKREIPDPRAFFENPFDQYTHEINELKNANDKTKFCALFLVVINNGFVDASVFTAEESQQVRSTRKNIFEECGVDRGIPRKRMQDHFDSLLDLFLKQSLICPGYTTIHDKMFDVLCHFFGEHLQVPFIKYVDPEVLEQRTQLKSIMQHPLNKYKVLIHQENNNKYMNRIVNDMLHERSFPSYLYHYYIDYVMISDYEIACSEHLIQFLYNLDVNKVQELICAADRNGCSLLTLACQMGDISMVKFLIENRADTDPFIKGTNKEANINRIIDNRFPKVSASSGKTPGADVDINHKYFEETPLTAICGNQLKTFDCLCEIIELLLDNGANVNRMVDKGIYRYNPLALFLDQTKLNISFQNEIDETAFNILKLLIDNGQNVNTVYYSIYWLEMTTPLTTACQIGDIRLINLLIEKGADVDPNIDDIEEIPLTATCRHESLKFDVQCELIKLLLDNGANVNRIVKNRLTRFCPFTVFLEKMMSSFEDGFLNVFDETAINILDLLIDKGHNVNIVYYRKDRGWTTPLITACQIGDIRLIKLLIEKGADVDPDIDDIWETPLTAACGNTSLKFDVQYEIFRLLIANGAT